MCHIIWTHTDEGTAHTGKCTFYLASLKPGIYHSLLDHHSLQNTKPYDESYFSNHRTPEKWDLNFVNNSISTTYFFAFNSLVHTSLLCPKFSFNVQFLQVQSNYISGVFPSGKVFLSVVFLSTALEKHNMKI